MNLQTYLRRIRVWLPRKIVCHAASRRCLEFRAEDFLECCATEGNALLERLIEDARTEASLKNLWRAY